jgi:hypothetical protein
MEEDVSDTTPMMHQSDNTALIGQSDSNDQRLKALKQRFRYCDYCDIEVS